MLFTSPTPFLQLPFLIVEAIFSSMEGSQIFPFRSWSPQICFSVSDPDCCTHERNITSRSEEGHEEDTYKLPLDQMLC